MFRSYTVRAAHLMIPGPAANTTRKPNGDYYIFAAHDLSFGTFGHPWEGTLCLWGSDLFDAVEARNAGVLTHLYRRDGKPVSDLRQP